MKRPAEKQIVSHHRFGVRIPRNCPKDLAMGMALEHLQKVLYHLFVLYKTMWQSAWLRVQGLNVPRG